MEIGKWILMLICLLVTLLGVIAIYDARIIVQKFFSFGDQNEASLGMKIIGFILAIMGTMLVFFNMG